MKEFKLHREDIKKSLKSSISKIHLSFNLWTSRKRRALNSITAHWVDLKGRCQTALLGLTEIEDIHSSKNLCANTLCIIEEYRIQENIGYFVLDNASSNNTAVEELRKELCFNAKWRRLRCARHIINLVARQVLFSKDYKMFEREITLTKEIKDEVKL